MNTTPTELKADAGTAKRSLKQALEIVLRLAALAIIFIGFGAYVYADTGQLSFFSPGNVENIVRQSTVFAIAALGATLVIITAGIDLSAGSVIALAMVVTAMLLRDGPTTEVVTESGRVVEQIAGWWCLVALVGGVLAGAVVGMLNGLMITGLRLAPFIVTLGSLQMIRGLGKGVANNREIVPPDNWLYDSLMSPVQNSRWADFNWQIVPLGVWLAVLAAVFATVLLRYTRFGRHVYAIGSNENTARLCGVPVVRTKIMVYALAGGFAGLAGVMEFSKLNIGSPIGAQMYELYIIAACVIGGASLMGGVGTIFGTLIGALIIGTLYAGATQAGWPKWVQEIVIGAVIVISVALDQLRNRRST